MIFLTFRLDIAEFLMTQPHFLCKFFFDLVKCSSLGLLGKKGDDDACADKEGCGENSANRADGKHLKERTACRHGDNRTYSEECAYADDGATHRCGRGLGKHKSCNCKNVVVGVHGDTEESTRDDSADSSVAEIGRAEGEADEAYSAENTEDDSGGLSADLIGDGTHTVADNDSCSTACGEGNGDLKGAEVILGENRGVVCGNHVVCRIDKEHCYGKPEKLLVLKHKLKAGNDTALGLCRIFLIGLALLGSFLKILDTGVNEGTGLTKEYSRKSEGIFS